MSKHIKDLNSRHVVLADLIKSSKVGDFTAVYFTFICIRLGPKMVDVGMIVPFNHQFGRNQVLNFLLLSFFAMHEAYYWNILDVRHEDNFELLIHKDCVLVW